MNITKTPYNERRGRPARYGDVARLTPGDCLHIPVDTLEHARTVRIGAVAYAREHGIQVKSQINKAAPEVLVFCIKPLAPIADRVKNSRKYPPILLAEV